jgi:ankyrin repeat protein
MGKRKLLATKEKDKDQLLLKAVRNGNEKALRRALQQGFDMETKQKSDGMTALNLACWKGHFDMAQVLLEAKADVNTTGNDGKTPLMGASGSGNEAMLHLLLEHGADSNMKDNCGHNAISYAQHNNHEGITTTLEVREKRGAREKE